MAEVVAVELVGAAVDGFVAATLDEDGCGAAGRAAELTAGFEG